MSKLTWRRRQQSLLILILNGSFAQDFCVKGQECNWKKKSRRKYDLVTNVGPKINMNVSAKIFLVTTAKTTLVVATVTVVMVGGRTCHQASRRTTFPVWKFFLYHALQSAKRSHLLCSQNCEGFCSSMLDSFPYSMDKVQAFAMLHKRPCICPKRTKHGQ